MKRGISVSMRVTALATVLAIWSAAASTALAWPGGPPDKVTISGPGLNDEVEVSGRERLNGLGPEQFMRSEIQVSAPTSTGEGYELVRYIEGFGGDGAFDRLRYYPPASGGPGYIFYAEAIGYGPSNHEGKWFYATEQGDAAMQRLLKELGASPGAPGATASRPAGGGAGGSFRGMLLAGGVLALGVGGALLGRARVRANRSRVTEAENPQHPPTLP